MVIPQAGAHVQVYNTTKDDIHVCGSDKLGGEKLSEVSLHQGVELDVNEKLFLGPLDPRFGDDGTGLERCWFIVQAADDEI